MEHAMRHVVALMIMVSSFVLPVAAMAGAWNHYDDKPLDWFRSAEAKVVAANVLAWQTARGDWPNDVDSSEPYDAARDRERGSFDDRHTTGDIRFLARMHRATGREIYREAALKAIDLIVAAQYPNGGFPQSADPGDGYDRYITFNDQAMVDILSLLDDIATEDEFAFAGRARRNVARGAFERGIGCILECQVVIDDRPTIWAAQYDEQTFEPRPARSFEPASLATAESVGVLRLLMDLDNPSPAATRAIEAGVRWFREHQIDGVRLVREDNDVRIAPDSNAPPLWARFYDLESEQPIFAGRDGVVRESLVEIERERRTGYAWYGRWGQSVLNKYENWSRQTR